ncbi:hypothetical protein M2145_001364 [Lachnospiraceae bacterium PF1-21]
MIIIQSKVQNLLVFKQLFGRIGSAEQFQCASDYPRAVKLGLMRGRW